MHPLGREDYPTESANRAHGTADTLLRRLREYCAHPTDAEDLGKDFSYLLPKIDQGLADLASVAELRGGAWNEPPDARLLAVVEAIPDIVVRVHAFTYVQRALGTESDLMDLRGAVSAAREAPPSSPHRSSK